MSQWQFGHIYAIVFKKSANISVSMAIGCDQLNEATASKLQSALFRWKFGHLPQAPGWLQTYNMAFECQKLH